MHLCDPGRAFVEAETPGLFLTCVVVASFQNRTDHYSVHSLF